MQLVLPLSLLLAAALCACRSTPEAEPVEFQRVRSGQVSGFEEPKNIVARSAEEWRALFRPPMHERGTPDVEIDWSRQMLIAVALGSRPSGGHAVEIESVARQGSHWVVRARETRPAPGTFQTAMITSPFDCVATPRFDGKVTFVVE